MQSLFRRADSRYGLQDTRLYGGIEGAGVFLPPLPAMFGVKRRNNVFHFLPIQRGLKHMASRMRRLNIILSELDHDF